MATTHQVAMITNSCFKSAVNPKTGLVSSTNAAEESALGASWFGRDADYLDDGRDTPKMHLSKSVNFDTTNSMMDTMNGVDLSKLTDEQFYERLSSLKADHKRTLALCERLYNEKLSEVRTGTAPVDNRQVPIASVDSNYMLTAPITQTMNGVSSSAELLQHRDHVRDMSASKPPIGKPRKSPGTPGKSGGKQAWARRSSEDFWKSQSMQSGRSSDAEMSGDEGDRSRTPLDRSLEALNASRASYMSHIEDMWDNFSVDEYAPRDKTRMGPRSSSMSRLPTSSAEEKSLTESQEWRNRITVPKPFKMTLREANKTPTKSKTMQELEEQRDEQQRREEAECQKRFKAKPVPAHVYMPLFQEVMENQETKRRYVQKVTADMLMSMQKPFKFDIREKEKKKYRRTQSTPDNSDLNKKPKTTFKAKPFPAHIFDNDVNDRMKEEEEYRKIRCQMRSEELIRSSSLPPNMAAKGREYTEGKSRQKVHAERAKKAGMTPEHKFRPYVNDTVPDFEQLHRQFLHEAMKKKNQREATVCKPFKMNAGNSATKRHKIYDQSMSETEDSIKENKSPFRRSKFRPVSSVLSTSLDSIPAKMTASAHLRSSSTKTKMQSAIEREMVELEKEHRRRQREKEMKRYIAERALTNDNTCILQSNTKEKLKEHKESDRARSMEYRRQLHEINARVKQRPLLFERTMQDNARQRAEKKYKETLNRAGVDEDFISSKGRSTDNDDLDLDSDISDDSPRYSSQHQSYSQSRSSPSRRYSDEFDGTATDRTVEEEDDFEDEVVED